MTMSDVEEGWRLPPALRQDLRDVACGVEESCAGICTRYLLDELERSSPPPADDVSLFEAENFVERYVIPGRMLVKLFGPRAVNDWRARVLRARRALTRLALKGDHEAIGTLHNAYGPGDPMTRAWPKASLDYLGPELTPLVRYVDATEVVRKQLVRENAVHYASSAATMAFALRNCTEAVDLEKMNLFERKALTASAEVISLQRFREREHYFERVITSADALRHIFDEKPVLQYPNETKAEWGERWSAQRDEETRRRAGFLTIARAEANLLLTSASRRFHTAWCGVK